MNTNNYTQREENTNLRRLNLKRARRKRKLLNKKNRKDLQRNSKLSIAMSSWAENFTMASNWQIKHELAYWKARAKALEYENGLLHDIIRKNHLGNQREQDTDNEDSEEQNEADDQNEEFDENAHCVEEDEEFTVSEEFIEFIKANAKFKEDARRERELLRQKENTDDITDEPQQTSVLSEDHYKELYGDKWERICALEMSLTADFMDKKDEYKPAYWPNIPFNFS